MTFDQCAKAYIAAHKASWKNAKHIDQWTATLNTYASPVFGKLPVAEVDTALVVRCLSPIWEGKHETASRLRGRIEAVLGWASTSGYRTGDNPARWKGHLENLLANINKSARVQNHPSLPWPQIGKFMAALKGREGIAASALELTILTASRSGEVRGARWSEFDLESKIWTIPAARMKAGREHQVPLAKEAIAILEKIRNHPVIVGRTVQADPVVFAGTKGQELSDMSLTAVLRRMNSETEKPIWIDANGVGITVHGFRSSFRMWAAEHTNYSRETAEFCLAHLLPDVVERAYQRGTQFAKRRELMSEWANFCSASADEETAREPSEVAQLTATSEIPLPQDATDQMMLFFQSRRQHLKKSPTTATETELREPPVVQGKSTSASDESISEFFRTHIKHLGGSSSKDS